MVSDALQGVEGVLRFLSCSDLVLLVLDVAGQDATVITGNLPIVCSLPLSLSPSDLLRCLERMAPNSLTRSSVLQTAFTEGSGSANRDLCIIAFETKLE